jgi:hypothetical protein
MHRLMEEEMFMYVGVLKVGYTVYGNVTEGWLPCVRKLYLKDKIVSGFSQTQQYIILFYLDDDMSLSLDHRQTIFTELGIRYMQCK